MKPVIDFSSGVTFRPPYPFIREKVNLFEDDGEGNVRHVEVESWRPGTRMEQVFVPPDDYDVTCVADGVGEILLTVVSIHKPGRFPARVFFTRQWKSPDGKEFGKGGCRCVTAEKFRRLAKGYAHPYEVKR